MPETSRERMRAALGHRRQGRIPRGELWLGSALFRPPQRGGGDTLQAQVELCLEMGMDFLSLPVEMPGRRPADHRRPAEHRPQAAYGRQGGYCRFSPVEIEAAAGTGLFVCAVVDGPFQQAARKPGDLSSLSAPPAGAASSRLEERTLAIEEVIGTCIGRGADAVVIADDIAYRASTYASPVVIRERLVPLYSRLAARIRGGGASALFHSDGNIASVLPDLLSCGFDGLAGCEPECLDLVSLKRTYGSRLTFMTGIRAGLLETASPAAGQGEGFLGELRALDPGCSFVLCSACGLSSRPAVERLKTLYAWADQAL